MRSEAKNRFHHGFDLTERELRRTFDTLVQQMTRISEDSPPVVSFEVKFRNGVVANTSSLDEILSLENVGSGAIIRLQMKIQDQAQDPNYAITLTFTNTDVRSEFEGDAITYTVVGDDRDWVFVTSSQVEERISRTKRFTPEQWFGRITRSDMLLAMIGAICVGFAVLLIPPFLDDLFGPDRTALRLQKLDALEARCTSGEITDALQLIVELERLRTQPIQSVWGEIYDYMMWGFIGLGVLMMGVLVWFRFFPAYNFIWGDYIRVYEKRRAARKFVLIGVVFTIIISVAANYLSSLLGIGK